jgi:hypothetical protein
MGIDLHHLIPLLRRGLGQQAGMTHYRRYGHECGDAAVCHCLSQGAVDLVGRCDITTNIECAADVPDQQRNVGPAVALGHRRSDA